MIKSSSSQSPNLLPILESVILKTVCEYLQFVAPSLTQVQLEFLCAPWAHYFSHSLWHRLELFQGNSLSNQENYLCSYALEPPGDTLSFMELSRTEVYRAYLDKTLAGEDTHFECRTTVNVLRFDQLSTLALTSGFQTCLPSKFRYMLSLVSFGKIEFLNDKPENLYVEEVKASRDALKKNIRLALSFLAPQKAAWFSSRLSELFPKSLLENLSSRVLQLKNVAPRRHLYSANGWTIIDDWKIFALIQKNQNGALFFGSPHSIGHGSLVHFWQRDFEINMLDRYMTWGKTVPCKQGREIVPFYSPYFAGRSHASPVRAGSNSGLMISAAARPKHLLEYPYTPERFDHYLKTQLALAKQAQILTGQSVVIRTRPNDLGWNVQAMVQALGMPEVTLEFQEGKFIDRLAKCRLHICDNCSTTILDSFWANHPTLVLITDNYFQIHPDASEEYDVLAQVGIFHTSLSSLLSHLVLLEGSRLDTWWKASDTQLSVNFFLERQGCTGSGLGDWKKGLLN